MLKIAVIDLGAHGLGVSGRRLFSHRPNSWPDECQHADIAGSCFNKGWEKYSALYFWQDADDESERKNQTAYPASCHEIQVARSWVLDAAFNAQILRIYATSQRRSESAPTVAPSCAASKHQTKPRRLQMLLSVFFRTTDPAVRQVIDFVVGGTGIEPVTPAV